MHWPGEKPKYITGCLEETESFLHAWHTPRSPWAPAPFPSPGDLPDTGIEPRLLDWQADSLLLSRQESPYSAPCQLYLNKTGRKKSCSLFFRHIVYTKSYVKIYFFTRVYTQIHTHTYIYIYIYLDLLGKLTLYYDITGLVNDNLTMNQMS